MIRVQVYMHTVAIAISGDARHMQPIFSQFDSLLQLIIGMIRVHIFIRTESIHLIPVSKTVM